MTTRHGRVCERCGASFITPRPDILLCRPCYTLGGMAR